ncbi:MAG: hypothetical protein PHR77_09040 [Kiritimatiellae bacterium]|nr:hypothetical protein [Kiritimatiellia bacterium]MDD5519378.1 hypothetical protein [Kiritimatiellia bacterium]
MKKTEKLISLVLSLSLILSFYSGCGNNSSITGKTMEIPELGISMNIPQGWKLDNPEMCHKGDNTGLLMEEGLEGRTFEKCAEQMSKEFGNKLISESKLTINGHNVIKTLGNTTEGHMLVRVYIHKGDKIAVISFVILKDQYPENDPKLQECIKSIRIK